MTIITNDAANMSIRDKTKNITNDYVNILRRIFYTSEWFLICITQELLYVSKYQPQSHFIIFFLILPRRTTMNKICRFVYYIFIIITTFNSTYQYNHYIITNIYTHYQRYTLTIINQNMRDEYVRLHSVTR